MATSKDAQCLQNSARSHKFKCLCHYTPSSLNYLAGAQSLHSWHHPPVLTLYSPHRLPQPRTRVQPRLSIKRSTCLGEKASRENQNTSHQMHGLRRPQTRLSLCLYTLRPLPRMPAHGWVSVETGCIPLPGLSSSDHCHMHQKN